MYTNSCYRRYLIAAVTLATLSLSEALFASTIIVSFDFEDDNGAFEDAPASLRPEVAASQWFDQHGSLTNFTGNPSSGRALAARTFAEGNSLGLILTVAPGFKAEIDGYSFDHLASSTGPQAFEFKVNGTSIVTGSTPSSFTNVNGNLALGALGSVIELELLGSDASSTSGTYRLDNFILTGTVTPVPIVPAFVLLASALPLMPRLARR